MDNITIEQLIPKAGPRLKFKKYFETFLSSSVHELLDNVSTISDSSSSLSSLEIVANNSSPAINVPDEPVVAENDCSFTVSTNTYDQFSSPECSVSVDTFSKVIDVKNIVQKKLPEIHQKLIEGDPAQINILEKCKINRVLVASHIEQYDCRPRTKDKLELAKHIVKVFPVLKGTDGEGFVSYFCFFFLYAIVLIIHFIYIKTSINFLSELIIKKC